MLSCASRLPVLQHGERHIRSAYRPRSESRLGAESILLQPGSPEDRSAPALGPPALRSGRPPSGRPPAPAAAATRSTPPSPVQRRSARTEGRPPPHSPPPGHAQAKLEPLRSGLPLFGLVVLLRVARLRQPRLPPGRRRRARSSGAVPGLREDPLRTRHLRGTLRRSWVGAGSVGVGAASLWLFVSSVAGLLNVVKLSVSQCPNHVGQNLAPCSIRRRLGWLVVVHYGRAYKKT